MFLATMDQITLWYLTDLIVLVHKTTNTNINITSNRCSYIEQQKKKKKVAIDQLYACACLTANGGQIDSNPLSMVAKLFQS